MTKSIEGDWRVLESDEPTGSDNRIYSFGGGVAADTHGKSAGS